MIIMLLGKAGAGKTTIAKRMEKYIKDSFVIDGDDLRKETENLDTSFHGRSNNMHLGLSRARRLSDLGFTVFVAMQAPFREIREEYLNQYDLQIEVTNSGPNPKDDKGYNIDFDPDYSDVFDSVEFTTFSELNFWNTFIPRVLVPARFQGFHKGHKVVLEEAKRLSPNVTIGLRTDDRDTIDIHKNITLLENRGYNVITTPNINEDWTSFADEYDYYVQGNPKVIEKFRDSTCKHYFVPRYGDVSGTQIRADFTNDIDITDSVDIDVINIIKESLL